MINSEKVFFRGGPLHALTRTLRGGDVGTRRITDASVGGRAAAEYRRTDDRRGDAIVYEYEENGADEA